MCYYNNSNNRIYIYLIAQSCVLLFRQLSLSCKFYLVGIKMNSILKSKNIKTKADEIFFKKGLNNILQNYGKIFYTGSYFLDLMVWLDLDIELSLKTNPFSLKHFFEIGEKIASRFKVVSMTFHNRIDFPIHEKGLYWNIIINYEKIDFNIDLWSFPENILKKNIKRMQILKNKITNDKKEKIINIKTSLLKEEGKIPRFSGYCSIKYEFRIIF